MSLSELIGALLSAWGVWLTARRLPLCWPVGMAAVLVYAWVFAAARLYSDALLQAAFAVFIAYGWLRWRRHLGDDGRVQVAALPPTQAWLQLGLGLLGALALGAAMQRWTNAALPRLDALLTAFSLIAQWWQARRHLAAWPLWIALDAVYVVEYAYKSLWITAVLYAGFMALAALGWREWRRASPASGPNASRKLG